MFSIGVLSAVEGVQYRGGYHEYQGGYHEYHGGIMSTVGDITSAMRAVQYRGGYHEKCGGYHEHSGGFSVPWKKLPHILYKGYVSHFYNLNFSIL